MEYTVDIFYCLGRQAALALPLGPQSVIKLLDGVGVQCLQLHRTQGGLDMVLDMPGIGYHGGGLHAAQIVRRPNVQPLPHGHLAGLLVCTGIQRGGELCQLLPDFLLCGSVDRPLHLFPRAWITAHSIAGLPSSVLPLANRPTSLGSSGVALSCHCNSSLKLIEWEGSRP